MTSRSLHIIRMLNCKEVSNVLFIFFSYVIFVIDAFSAIFKFHKQYFLRRSFKNGNDDASGFILFAGFRNVTEKLCHITPYGIVFVVIRNTKSFEKGFN